jgi:hypothetical protein
MTSMRTYRDIYTDTDTDTDTDIDIDTDTGTGTRQTQHTHVCGHACKLALTRACLCAPTHGLIKLAQKTVCV